ncbi:MAG: HAD-IIB family hydrolase [Candidatus Nomurabacteria bacterium]|jgi:HAD superfamily hydrolase (TIGR01484 family)|nr:HAD-IIB family hydrolase [Candidatus Nomurabacteria bacterium]
MKKIIAFDQDDTVNITKQPIDDEMAELLAKLLKKFDVAIVSGTNWPTMRRNDFEPLKRLVNVSELKRYHIMPTCGTQYWRFVGADAKLSAADQKSGKILEDGWRREYAHFLNDEQVEKISAALERASKSLGFWCDQPAGEIIENRQSQITLSALGQFASTADKYAWDPDQAKRRQIVKLVEPELEPLGVMVRIGGTTSIDVTLPGIDKAYAMRQLMKMLGVKKSEILFIGDKLQPGGNDFPVKDFGVDTIEVRDQADTKLILQGILAVS